MSAVHLRRFWFKSEAQQHSPLGYGVTAWTKAKASITANIDLSTLDAARVLPNMESQTWRDIWFLRGLAENSN